MKPFPVYASEIDLETFEVIPVSLKTLSKYYNDPKANIYVFGEIAEGFSEEEIREAYINGRSVVAVKRKEK